MDKKALFFALTAFVFALLGCQTRFSTVKIDSVTIPDQTYEVTVHESHPLHYAVVFDIPDDGKQVAMFHTYSTKRIGSDGPGKYIDRFNTRVKGFRTFQITDQDGTVRGYLMISNLLGYLIYERPVGERIVVMIEDPHHGGEGFRRVP